MGLQSLTKVKLQQEQTLNFVKLSQDKSFFGARCKPTIYVGLHLAPKVISS